MVAAHRSLIRAAAGPRTDRRTRIVVHGLVSNRTRIFVLALPGARAWRVDAKARPLRQADDHGHRAAGQRPVPPPASADFVAGCAGTNRMICLSPLPLGERVRVRGEMFQLDRLT